METCPHGMRITVAVGEPVLFIDECNTCETLLAELGFKANIVTRESVSAA